MKESMKINQYDEDDKRHGLWQDYYSTGQIYFKGKYKNGKEHGPWETYEYGGKLWHKGVNNNDKRAGLWYEAKYED
jgi:antitoxin component YwqK of YwqJK toxin-antitoxin module